LGRVKKGELCSIKGCRNRAVKSISSVKALNVLSKLNLDVVDKGGRRVYLCELHYKMFKKATKKDRLIEKWWKRL